MLEAVAALANRALLPRALLEAVVAEAGARRQSPREANKRQSAPQSPRLPQSRQCSAVSRSRLRAGAHGGHGRASWGAREREGCPEQAGRRVPHLPPRFIRMKRGTRGVNEAWNPRRQSSTLHPSHRGVNHPNQSPASAAPVPRGPRRWDPGVAITGVSRAHLVLHISSSSRLAGAAPSPGSAPLGPAAPPAPQCLLSPGRPRGKARKAAREGHGPESRQQGPEGSPAGKPRAREPCGT